MHTTIDLDKQRLAREAIKTKLGDIGPSSALVTINPKNGYILAMASSADYAETKFNLAAQGERQPGSSFKTFALMTALRRRREPEHDALHVGLADPDQRPASYGAPFEIKTYGGTSGGNMNLVQATLRSDNSVYIQLALDLGPDKVAETAVDMGIKRRHVHGYPAESLGGLENGVSPLEMATAYATIASGGYRNRPTAITKVEFEGTGRSELPAPLAAAPHEGVPGRRDLRGDEDPRGEHPGRHRHAREHRLPGRRQDRHDRPEHRRVVRRLHAAPGHRRLGRLPQRPHADERPLLRPQRRRRHVPRRHLGRVHEPGQGQLLRRLPAAQGAVRLAAVLRRATRAAAATSSATGTSPRRTSRPTAEDDTTDEPPTTDEDNTGGTEFDPDQYESPPQGDPDTQPPPDDGTTP